MIYFDNAATSYPKPKRVLQATQEAAARYGANPGRSGHTMAMRTAEKVYECREAAAELFHAEKPEDVVFCANTTHAINLALKGALQQGDHVIISDLEHNAILRPVYEMAHRGMITWSMATVYPDDDEATLASFAAEIRPETRMIACIHASNVFGVRLPIREIGALCTRHDLLFLVDAAQTAGVMDIDMQDSGIDFLCTAGHKSLYGPSGTGLLITSLGASLNTVMEGGTGSHSILYRMPEDMPDRLECGTVNTTGIIGLRAGIHYIAEKTPQVIYRHEMKIGAEIHRRLQDIPGVILYTETFEEGVHLPVISFNLQGMHSEETADRLSQAGFALRAGLHCAPLAHQKTGTLETGTVRISIGAFNTTAQAVQLCEQIKKTASAL